MIWSIQEKIPVVTRKQENYIQEYLQTIWTYGVEQWVGSAKLCNTKLLQTFIKILEMLPIIANAPPVVFTTKCFLVP